MHAKKAVPKKAVGDTKKKFTMDDELYGQKPSRGERTTKHNAKKKPVR